jgi:hypothetical protein
MLACDALISAAGLVALGSNFGSGEPAWSGASGVALLGETARRLVVAGYGIGNVAVQLVGRGAVRATTWQRRVVEGPLPVDLVPTAAPWKLRGRAARHGRRC